MRQRVAVADGVHVGEVPWERALPKGRPRRDGENTRSRSCKRRYIHRMRLTMPDAMVIPVVSEQSPMSDWREGCMQLRGDADIAEVYGPVRVYVMEYVRFLQDEHLNNLD